VLLYQICSFAEVKPTSLGGVCPERIVEKTGVSDGGNRAWRDLPTGPARYALSFSEAPLSLLMSAVDMK
jgi:hypothetical protein